MEKSIFQQHLQTVTEVVVKFTREFCFNDFHKEFRYVITPNARTVTPKDEHLTKYETDVLQQWNLHEGQRLTDDQVVGLLWHEGKVPIWIDVAVIEVTEDQTILDLFCSRRLRDDSELMHGPITPPFHIQVLLPPDYQKEVLFDVNWKKYYQRSD